MTVRLGSGSISSTSALAVNAVSPTHWAASSVLIHDTTLACNATSGPPPAANNLVAADLVIGVPVLETTPAFSAFWAASIVFAGASTLAARARQNNRAVTVVV